MCIVLYSVQSLATTLQAITCRPPPSSAWGGTIAWCLGWMMGSAWEGTIDWCLGRTTAAWRLGMNGRPPGAWEDDEQRLGRTTGRKTSHRLGFAGSRLGDPASDCVAAGDSPGEDRPPSGEQAPKEGYGRRHNSTRRSDFFESSYDESVRL